jgi:hypothetical protein
MQDGRRRVQLELDLDDGISILWYVCTALNRILMQNFG